MGGIAGIYYLNGHPAERNTLGSMVDVMAHRGPDGVGVWCEGAVGLGHLMLYTTPESLEETQPVIRDGGQQVLVADAVLYNREELIGQLDLSQEGPVTDSALILAAYQRWGRTCPEHLIGDFAFALWDSRRRQLFCARDHFGVKPFYYYYVPGHCFFFASEAKALLQLEGVPAELNALKIAEHLLAPVEEDPTRTFYKHLHGIAPAHSLTVTPADFQARRYWKLDPHRELRLASDAAYAERFRELFGRAVGDRLRTAFPVGSLLSGGLDSSSIACMAARILGDEHGNRLHTFSAVFDKATQSDERTFISDVVKAYDVQSHYVSADDVSPLVDFEQIGWHIDRANDAANLYVRWELSKVAAAQGVRVLLDGYDGDTTVSHGRGYFYELRAQGRWLTLGREVRAFAERLDENWRRAVWSWFRGPVYKSLGVAHLVKMKKAMARRSETKPGAVVAERPAWSRAFNPAFVEALTPHLVTVREELDTEREHHHHLLTRSFLAESLGYMDAVSAALGVESRYPFFDKRLVEFCLSLPPAQKLRRGWSRLVMRHAMEGILPATIQWRPDKGNLEHAFNRGLLTFEKERLAKIADDTFASLEAYVDGPFFKEAFSRFINHRSDEAERVALWRVFSLALWLQEDSTPARVSTPKMARKQGAVSYNCTSL